MFSQLKLGFKSLSMRLDRRHTFRKQFGNQDVPPSSTCFEASVDIFVSCLCGRIFALHTVSKKSLLPSSTVRYSIQSLRSLRLAKLGFAATFARGVGGDRFILPGNRTYQIFMSSGCCLRRRYVLVHNMVLVSSSLLLTFQL